MTSKIEYSQLDIIIMQVGSPLIPSQVMVTWIIEPARNPGSTVSFEIQRSLTPNFSDADAIETLGQPIPLVAGQTIYEYLDITANLQNFWRKYFYRIVATDSANNNHFVSTTKTWDSDPKVFELEIIARHDWLLQYETGTPCFAFIERTAGNTHCPSCWNPSLQRVTRSNCSVCFGTGRERPYYQPILTFIDFNPSTNITQMSSKGETQVNQGQVWWSAYPQLKIRDILVEVMSGVRWRVNVINPVGDVRTPIHYFGTLERINARDIEMQVVVPADIQRTAVNALAKMKAERRF